MPKRNNVKVYPSEEVQGEGSAVTMRDFTIGEWKEYQSKLSAASPEEQAVLGQEVVAKHILDWNWVDDAGEPFPLPSADIAVLDRLTEAEVAFINRHMYGLTEEQTKN